MQNATQDTQHLMKKQQLTEQPQAEHTPTILQKIVQTKRLWLANKQAELPLADFQPQVVPTDRNFYHAIQQAVGSAFILECKKASPSKGLIRDPFNIDEIVQVYRHYATAISVLTDEDYFQGDFRYLRQVREQVSQPVLCKDFIIDEYQVYLARYHQADAILLMLSVLDDETYCRLADLAHQLGMGVLTESSNPQEFERALALKAKVIGVNNRNLHDLTIDLQCVVRLVEQYREKIPAETKIISESGIYCHEQVRELRAVADGFLIGSSLMAEPDLNNAVRAVIFGENKVCGLTRSQDVRDAYQNGALYGGLIFVEQSKRCVSLRQAQELTTQAPLRFVGVFQNQAVDFVVKMATQLNLYAVQLHGSENEAYIQELHQKLGEQCQIWQAISIPVEAQERLTIEDNPLIARYIFDSKTAQQQGGTGVPFNWQILPLALKPKALLAGGISPENIENALTQGCVGVDLNSGIEKSAGVKDLEKLHAVFNQIIKGKK